MTAARSIIAPCGASSIHSPQSGLWSWRLPSRRAARPPALSYGGIEAAGTGGRATQCRCGTGAGRRVARCPGTAPAASPRQSGLQDERAGRPGSSGTHDHGRGPRSDRAQRLPHRPQGRIPAQAQRAAAARRRARTNDGAWPGGRSHGRLRRR